MKFVYIGATAVLAALLTLGAVRLTDSGKSPVSSFNIGESAAEQELKKIKDQEEADARLGQYAINMMYAAGAKNTLSDAKKQILARAIVRVANDIFTTEDNKKAFVMVLAIESAFQKFAQSPTGPKGYAQLAKGSFHEAMSDCGVTELRDDDVWETDLNLYAGACYFKKLLIKNNNDPYISIVGYNQGPNSKSVKSYSKNGTMEEVEPLRYIARFTFFQRNVTDQKQPNIPALHELNKPTPPTTETTDK